MSQFNIPKQALQKKPGAAPIRLNSQVGLNQGLQSLRSHIIQSNEQGLPRYGVLSVLARRVPFHLYDHPALTVLCDTAFTDGIHLFVNAQFFREVQQEDRQGDKQGVFHSMLLILLHELCHILMRHHARLPGNAPPILWAIACDITINARLLTAYPRLRAGPVFDSAWGSKPEEIEQYLGHSEEHIMMGLWQSPLPSSEAFMQQLKRQLEPPSSEPEDNQPSSDNREDNPENKPPKDTRGEALGSEHHLISPQTLAEALEQNGLQHIREVLKLPDPNDKFGFQQLEALAQLQLTSDLDKARELREMHPTGAGMAGDDFEKSSTELLDNQYRSQLEWKNLLRELLLGEGTFYQHCDEMPSDIFYVPPEQMGLAAPLFVGSQTPAGPQGQLICIIDTSKSVSLEMLQVFVNELGALVEHENVQQAQLHLSSADTQLRGDFLTFSQQALADMPQQMLMHGRGGTDMTRVINDTMQWAERQPEVNVHELKAIIYFTDLLDKPPQAQQLPEALPPLLFLAPPSLAVKAFSEQVKSFATVAEIKEGTIVDLCQN